MRLRTSSAEPHAERNLTNHVRAFASQRGYVDPERFVVLSYRNYPSASTVLTVRDLKTDMRIEHEISDSELLYTTDVEVVAANAVEQCLVQLALAEERQWLIGVDGPNVVGVGGNGHTANDTTYGAGGGGGWAAGATGPNARMTGTTLQITTEPKLAEPDPLNPKKRLIAIE